MPSRPGFDPPSVEERRRVPWSGEGPDPLDLPRPPEYLWSAHYAVRDVGRVLVDDQLPVAVATAAGTRVVLPARFLVELGGWHDPDPITVDVALRDAYLEPRITLGPWRVDGVSNKFGIKGLEEKIRAAAFHIARTGPNEAPAYFRTSPGARKTFRAVFRPSPRRKAPALDPLRRWQVITLVREAELLQARLQARGERFRVDAYVARHLVLRL